MQQLGNQFSEESEPFSVSQTYQKLLTDNFQNFVPADLTKTKVFTYTSYKEHFELYTEIHGLIAANTCTIELARKDMILVSDVTLILYKVGLCMVFQDIHIKFTVSVGTYSIADFKVVIY